MTFLPFPTILVKQPIPAATCTWDPASLQGAIVLLPGASGPDLVMRNDGTGPYGADIGTVGKNSGLRYFEVVIEGSLGGLVAGGVGISQAANTVSPYTFGGSGYGIQFSSDGNLKDADTFGTIVGYGPNSFGSGKVVVMTAINFSTLKYWGGIDGTFVGNPSAGTGGQPIIAGTYFPACQIAITGTETMSATGNFSAGTWTYLPPPGFSQWR